MRPAKIRVALQSDERPRLESLHHQSSVQRMLFGRSLRPMHRLFSTTPYRRADPWPLPHTKQHMEATSIPPNIPKPIPIPRHNESLETLRARLTYQTRKRGTLESDLIMSTFAKEQLHSLTREELLELDQVTSLETDSSPSGCSTLQLIGTEHSCLTNLIGTCTIGAQRGKRLLSGGLIRQFSRNLKFTRGTTVRLFVACLTLSRRSVLREWT